MNISVTERQIWKRCRRQWDLSSYNRQSLARMDSVPNQFSIGTALHLSFSAHVAGLEPREVVQDWLLAEEKRILGGRGRENPELQQRLYDARGFTDALVQHYFDYWGWDNPLQRQKLKYIAAEVALQAEVPGRPGDNLMGTIDGIAEGENGDIWLVEHKTYAQKPHRGNMDVNDQMTAYMWLFREVFGYLPAGVVYDGVGKKLPAVPKRLANGSMSQQWVDTTAAVYVRALHDAGLNLGPYIDLIARLEDRDAQEQNPFFTRWLVEIPRRSMDMFGTYLPAEFAEMSGIQEKYPVSESWSPPPELYPNFRWDGCWDCGVQELCRAIQFGEDFPYIRDTFYVKSGGHETVKSAKIKRGDLDSVYDLRDHVPNVLKTMGYGVTT